MDKEFTVISYNLKGIREGIDSLIEILSEAHVLAIQGVNKYNQDPLFRAAKSRGFQYYRFQQALLRPDGEILFTRFPVHKKDYKEFSNTGQGRGLTTYIIRTDDEEVSFVTSQLELGDESTRLKGLQIKEFNNLLKGKVIFAGDTTILSWQERDFDQPQGWLDAWFEKGTADNEKTSLFDRRDRIWYRGVTCRSFGVIDVEDNRKQLEPSSAIKATFTL